MWGPDKILGEAYELRMILEITLWGLWALALEGLVNLSGMANFNNPNYPNATGNDVGLFKVEIMYYKLTGFMKIM